MEITSGIHSVRLICRKGSIIHKADNCGGIYRVRADVFYLFRGECLPFVPYNYRSCQKVENLKKMGYDIIIKL